MLAPDVPLTSLRRPRSQFVNLLGFGAFFLLVGLGVPWLVEAGVMESSQWLIASLFNWLGPNGFRALGVGLALACLAGLLVITVNNPADTGEDNSSSWGWMNLNEWGVPYDANCSGTGGANDRGDWITGAEIVDAPAISCPTDVVGLVLRIS